MVLRGEISLSIIGSDSSVNEGEISLAEVVDYWAGVQDMVLADGTFSPFNLDIIDQQVQLLPVVMLSALFDADGPVLRNHFRDIHDRK